MKCFSKLSLVSALFYLQGLHAQTEIAKNRSYPGRVVCENKKECSVKNVVVSSFWSMDNGRLVLLDPGADKPEDSRVSFVTTNQKGKFVFTMKPGHQHYPFLVYAVNEDQTLGGFGWIMTKDQSSQMQIKLEKLVNVFGTVAPTEEFQPTKLSCNFTLMRDDKKSFSGVGQFDTSDLTYSFLLPHGSYRIWVDAYDAAGNTRRVLIPADIADTTQSDLHLPTYVLESKLQRFVGTHVSTWKNPSIWGDAAKQFPLGKVLVYLLTDYCSPCLAADGLAWYVREAAKGNGAFQVIGLASDFYKWSSPTKEAFLERIKRTPLYPVLKDPDLESGNASFLLDQGSFADELEILAYPTLLFFEDGILVDWKVGEQKDAFKKWVGH